MIMLVMLEIYKHMFIINHIDMYRNVFTYMITLYVVNLKLYFDT